VSQRTGRTEASFLRRLNTAERHLSDVCEEDWLAGEASLNGRVGTEIQLSCLGMDRDGLPRLLAAGEEAAAVEVSEDRSLGETPPHHSLAAPGYLPSRGVWEG